MNRDGGRSLLTWLPAPVLVGDPEGRVVYVNPAFERRFGVLAKDATGVPLASLFEGGGREAVLRAVAETCHRGREVRFRLRESGGGWTAVAAPIVAENENVGSLLLLQEEILGEEQVLAFHREIQEPLGQLVACLDSLLEQTGGRRSLAYRDQLEEGLRAVQRIEKWSAQLRDGLMGKSSSGQAQADAQRLVREISEQAARAAEAGGHGFERLLPSDLPAVAGDEDVLGAGLLRYLRERMASCPGGSSFTLAARALPDGKPPCVLLTFTEVGSGGSFAMENAAPPAHLQQLLGAIGGSVVQTSDPVAGTTTTIRLPLS